MGLAYIALAWAAGLFVADRIPGIGSQTWLLLGIGGVGAWFFTRDLTRWRFAAALLAATGLAAARMASQPQSSDVAALNGSGGVTIEGYIVDPPDVRDLYVQVRIAVETAATTGGDMPTHGLVLARIPPTSDVSYGDRVRLTGRLRTPEEGDAFDYATYLARRDVFSLLDRVSGVEVVSQGHGFPLVAAAVDVRNWARDRIAAVLPEPHAGILTAILTGDERSISPSVAQAYSDSGIAHLLAVSGFNMALVGGVAQRGLDRAESKRWVWLLLGLSMLFSYTLLVGFAPSASRAAFMNAVVLVGSAIRRRSNLLISLGTSLMVLTAIDPDVLFDLGFQLSFSAVLGIVLFGRPLTNLFRDLLRPDVPHNLPRLAVATLTEAGVVTVAASALTMPLVGLTFGRLPLVSFVTNVLVVPLQPLVMFLDVGVLLASGIPLIAQSLAWLCLVPLAWTSSVARVLATSPIDIAFNVHQVLVGAGFGLAIFASIATATRPPWLDALRSRRIRLGGMLIMAGVWVLAIGSVTSRPDGQLHVWILDVGHSHAVLIQTPSGAHVLIDGGRYPSRLVTSIGERLPFNDADLDAVFVTQPDPFDIGAVAAALKRYPVGQIYTNGQPNFSPEFAELAGHAAMTPLTAGQVIDTGDGVQIEVLHPSSTPGVDDPLDDVAMVLRVRYGGISFLLGGESSSVAQSEMMETLDKPESSVLLLPKHGGARSLDADFLDAVQPSIIVIQTDRANVLGDPNPDILEMLPEVPVYRTDEHGTLHFFSDGRDIYIETEK